MPLKRLHLERIFLFASIVLITLSCSSDSDDNTISQPPPVSEPDPPANKPPSISKQVFSASENLERGSVIGVVEASDPEGDALSFSLDNNTDFSIDRQSGELVLTSFDFELMDYETNESIEVEVEVSDGKNTSRGIVEIQIEDIEDGPLSNRQKWTAEEFIYINFEVTGAIPGGTPAEMITTKWYDPIRIYLDGDVTDMHRNDIIKWNEEIESLAPEYLDIELVDNLDDANVHFFVGTREELKDVFLGMYNWAVSVGNEWGGAQMVGAPYYGQLKGFQAWVSYDEPYIYFHELGHVLGLGHISKTLIHDYCFMGDYRADYELSKFDKDMIRIKYHPKIEAFSTQSQVEALIEEILLEIDD